METPEFARSVESWFAENVPHGWVAEVESMDDEQFVEFQRSWLRTLNTEGFAAPGVARKWGGGGYSVSEQAVIFSMSARYQAPPTDVFEVCVNHVPGTFLSVGTEEQKGKYIRQAIEGTIWCQGFSEPGAGSDLAGIKTRAVRDGDGWRVSGQKIWSSHASHARYCLLLARSEAGSSRREGITYFVMDMTAPGITVRPIQQIHGPSDFCEIFMDKVFIAGDCIIGEVNDGWRVAQSTLAAERGPMALPTIERMGEALAQMLATASVGRDGTEAPMTATQGRLVDLYARQAAVQSLALDTVDLLESGQNSGALASLIKTSFSELLQEMTDVATMISPQDTLLDRGSPHFLGYASGRWMTDWLGSWAATIAGGTNEVQRDIIAERVLGMPREVARTTGSRS